MNDILQGLLTGIAGMMLGVIFFGGLWLTVTRGLGSRWPFLWFLVSFILRVTVTLIGFYFLSQGNWINLLMGLIGFAMSRYLFMRYSKSVENKSKTLGEEVKHEI